MKVSLLARRALLAALFVSSAFDASGISDTRSANATPPPASGCPECSLSNCPEGVDLSPADTTTTVPFCYEYDNIFPSHCLEVTAKKYSYIVSGGPLEPGGLSYCWKRECNTPAATPGLECIKQM